MGKTASGAVWLDPNKTSPYDFYQYWRNVDDADVLKCIRMLPFLPLEEIEAMDKMCIRDSLSGAAARGAQRQQYVDRQECRRTQPPFVAPARQSAVSACENPHQGAAQPYSGRWNDHEMCIRDRC